MFRRYLYISVVAGCLVFAQQTGGVSQDPREREHTGVPDSTVSAGQTESPAPIRSAKRPQQRATLSEPATIPRAQYSPLAAAGGYAPRGISPWQAIVNYFNPRHLNMGEIFAERKQAWLDNALYNQYFWYAFWVTGMLILSWFAIAWIHNDRVRETWELAEFAADAVGYAEYCKRAAKEAITKYNQHVETCNRVIESQTSGLVTPETANLESYKQEIARLRNDNEAKTVQIERVQAELEQANKRLSDFTARLDAAEQRVQGNGSNAAVALAERINRLEGENAALKIDIKRLRQAAKKSKQQPADPKENRNLETDAAAC